MSNLQAKLRPNQAGANDLCVHIQLRLAHVCAYFAARCVSDRPKRYTHARLALNVTSLVKYISGSRRPQQWIAKVSIGTETQQPLCLCKVHDVSVSQQWPGYTRQRTNLRNGCMQCLHAVFWARATQYSRQFPQLEDSVTWWWPSGPQAYANIRCKPQVSACLPATVCDVLYVVHDDRI